MILSNVDSPLASSDLPQPEEPSSSGEVPPATRDVVASVLALAVGFFLTAAMVHLCIRDPLHLYAEIRSEKLSILEQWRGRAGSAAFGSSHVDNGFDPRAFDAQILGKSSAATTINLGVSGGAQTEQAAIVDEFIDSLVAPSADSPPRFLLLEITASANFTKDHLFHPRAINIYDFRTVELAMNFAERDRIGLHRALGRSGFAFIAGVLHYTNVGMLSSMIFSAPLNTELMAKQSTDDRRGFTPILMAPQGSREWNADQKILADHRSPQPKRGEIVEGHFTMLRRLADKAREKHVRFVYFVAPRLDNLDTYPTFPDSIPGPLGPVFILNVGLPHLHPELYRAEMWHDPTHLTAAGAALFSRLLADDLMGKIDRMNSQGAPGN